MFTRNTLCPLNMRMLKFYNDTYGHEIEMYTVEQGEKRDKRQ